MILLIEPAKLATRLDNPRLRLIDTRFSLQDTSLGWRQYQASHLPGAVYADLEADLSGTIISGVTGRHPLPEPTEFSMRLRRWGIDAETPVVIYDDGSHAMAARLWWLLAWAGLDSVQILHGGFSAWIKAGLPVTADVTTHMTSDYQFEPRDEWVVTAEQVEQLAQKNVALLDARGKTRFTGEEEPMDSVAGHIPGAVCLPFTENMDSNNRFLSSEALVRRFLPFYAKPGSDDTTVPVCYCGSGVTACHNILATQLAGLPWPQLYADSWSDWITDKSRPVATGQ